MIRYGVVGIRGVGDHHIRWALDNPDVELTAIAEVDEATLSSRSEDLGVRGFTSAEEMLAAGVVDAVSLAVPHHLHARLSLAALEAGVHVFVEKPLANRLSEANAIVETAEARDLVVAVGHQYRFFRSMQAVKRLIDDGAIGEVNRLLWTWMMSRPAAYYSDDPWRASWNGAGGGVLANQASHDLDLACWLMGIPVEVSALALTQLHDVEVEDAASVSMRWENGALGTFQFSLNQPVTDNVRQIGGDRGVIVYKEVASLTADRDDAVVLGRYRPSLREVLANGGGHDQPDIDWEEIRYAGRRPGWRRAARRLKTVRALGRRLPGRARSPRYRLLDSFVAAVQGRGEPLVSARSARDTVEVMNAAVMSAVQRRAVSLPLDPAEYDEVFSSLASGSARIDRPHRAKKS